MPCPLPTGILAAALAIAPAAAIAGEASLPVAADEAPLAAGPAAQGTSTFGKVGQLVDIGGILFVVSLTGLLLLEDNDRSSTTTTTTTSTSGTS